MGNNKTDEKKSFINELLEFIKEDDIKQFCLKTRKIDKVLKELEAFIKSKDGAAKDVWFDFFVFITKAFRQDQNESDGVVLNKIYFTLIELLPYIIDDEEDEKRLFKKISEKLQDSDEYGIKLIVYRALRYSVQYNDDETGKKILDSRILQKDKNYFQCLDFHDDYDPLDQSKMIKWFLYRYDVSNAIKYLSMVSFTWNYMIKLLDLFINKGLGPLFIIFMILYCNIPYLHRIAIPRIYFHYLEFIFIILFVLLYLKNRHLQTKINKIRAIILVFQISLPRIWGAILIGLITIALSEVSWVFPLNIDARSFSLICLLLFISAYLYLYLEISFYISDPDKAGDKTAKILLLGFIESFFFSYLVSRLFYKSIFPYLISEEALKAVQGEYIYYVSDFLAMPKYIPTLMIYPPLIILWTFLSLLIGMFIQNFWARETLIRSPFDDSDMDLKEAPQKGENK